MLRYRRKKAHKRHFLERGLIREHKPMSEPMVKAMREHITLELMQKTFEDHAKNNTEEEFNEFVDVYWSGLEGTGV